MKKKLGKIKKILGKNYRILKGTKTFFIEKFSIIQMFFHLFQSKEELYQK